MFAEPSSDPPLPSPGDSSVARPKTWKNKLTSKDDHHCQPGVTIHNNREKRKKERNTQRIIIPHQTVLVMKEPGVLIEPRGLSEVLSQAISYSLFVSGGFQNTSDPSSHYTTCSGVCHMLYYLYAKTRTGHFVPSATTPNNAHRQAKLALNFY